MHKVLDTTDFEILYHKSKSTNNKKRSLLKNLKYKNFWNVLDILKNAKGIDYITHAGGHDQFNNVIKFEHYGTTYILKTFNSKGDELTNEAFIAIHGTNNLSGFAKILKIEYKIWHPIHEIYFDYTIQEYIDGIELKKRLKYLDINDTPEILLQIIKDVINIIYKAYTSINFTHYDLKTDNIIIKDNIPYIIDYGTSHIKMDNVDYGINVEYANIYNKGFWVSDIIKLLICILRIIKGNNNIHVILNGKVSQYLQYFFYVDVNEKFIQNVIDVNLYHNIGYSKKADNLKFEDFIKYINS
jgi:serine/threonine protein kinase